MKSCSCWFCTLPWKSVLYMNPQITFCHNVPPHNFFTWLACSQDPCLWSPSLPVCSGDKARSVECASVPVDPPCSHRSTSPSASWSHSDSHSPLQIKPVIHICISISLSEMVIRTLMLKISHSIYIREAVSLATPQWFSFSITNNVLAINSFQN